MNREFLLEAVLGITIGLILAIVAVYRTRGPVKPGSLRRAGMAAVLVYVVIAAPILVQTGLIWWGLLVLLVLAALPVVGMLAARGRSSEHGAAGQWARLLVGVGLCAAMLIAAGQTLSLVSLLDPRMLVVVIAVVTGLLVAQDALAASGRIGSLAMWLMIVPVLICLALGFLLGDAGQTVSPIIEVTGPSPWTILALAAGFVVLGWADAGLAASHQQGGWSPVRVLGGAFAIVVLIAVGLLMFFGGAIWAPSMQFFVVPANINAVPGLAGALFAVLTVLFAALVAAQLGGMSAGEAPTRWLAIGATAAVVLALLDPGLEWVVTASALAAASLVARFSRGTSVGLVLAALAAAGLTLTGHMDFSWQFLAAVLTVLVVSALSGKSAGDRSPEPVATA